MLDAIGETVLSVVMLDPRQFLAAMTALLQNIGGSDIYAANGNMPVAASNSSDARIRMPSLRNIGADEWFNCTIRYALRLIIILLFAPTACNLAAATNSGPPVSSKVYEAKCDLCGVWTGISIASCTAARITGPWRCGAKSYIKLTFIKETSTTTGFYTSIRGSAGNVFEQTGRILKMPIRSATRLWLRVIMRDHSSCLFNSNLPGEEIKGSYFCFHNASSAELGQWAVQRIY
jgi:hypothetical protein